MQFPPKLTKFTLTTCLLRTCRSYDRWRDRASLWLASPLSQPALASKAGKLRYPSPLSRGEGRVGSRRGIGRAWLETSCVGQGLGLPTGRTCRILRTPGPSLRGRGCLKRNRRRIRLGYGGGKDHQSIDAILTDRPRHRGRPSFPRRPFRCAGGSRLRACRAVRGVRSGRSWRSHAPARCARCRS